MMSINVIQFAP